MATARRFNLRLWVVAVTLTTVVIVHAALAFALSRYIAREMIRQEGSEAQDFFNSILTAEGTADVLFTPQGDQALASFARHLTSMPGLLRANVYGADRVIRHSSDTALIGSVPEEVDDLDLALKGQMSTSLNSEVGDTVEAKGQFLLPESGRVIEAYLPLSNAQGRVVGVVEYYRDATVLREVLSHVTLIVWVAAAISGLVILVALYGAAARATRRIDQQTRELQSLSVMASLGQMATAVTHSLRNPLASIRSSIELLHMTHPGIADDTVADVTQEIDRIDRHVQDLLAFAGSDRGEAQPVALGGMLAAAIDRIAPRAQRGQVVIETAPIPADLAVLVEPRLVLQVFESLFTNAIDAMPGGGRIRIAAVESGKRVLVSVTDTGPGLPKSMVGAPPVPFATTKLRGLGLGLAISDRLLALFDGGLRLANEPAGGAVITVDLRRGPGQ